MFVVLVALVCFIFGLNWLFSHGFIDLFNYMSRVGPEAHASSGQNGFHGHKASANRQTSRSPDELSGEVDKRK